MDYERWMGCVCETINSSLTVGSVFELKQLFPGHEWEKLSRGERSAFGKFFSNAVKEGKVSGINRYEEGKNHHNRYVKKGK